jgi:hypothetical protein
LNHGIAPGLSGRTALPFAIALFIGNIVSVLLLNYLVPWTSNRFSWWLQPRGAEPRADCGRRGGAGGRPLRPDGSAVLATVLTSPWKTLQLLQSVNRPLTTDRAKWG